MAFFKIVSSAIYFTSCYLMSLGDGVLMLLLRIKVFFFLSLPCVTKQNSILSLFHFTRLCKFMVITVCNQGDKIFWPSFYHLNAVAGLHFRGKIGSFCRMSQWYSISSWLSDSIFEETFFYLFIVASLVRLLYFFLCLIPLFHSYGKGLVPSFVNIHTRRICLGYNKLLVNIKDSK